MVTMRILLVLILAMTLSACGKNAEAPGKTAEQEKAEKDAASKAVRDNPVYGDQFKALDKAKATAAAADESAKKTEEALKKAEEPKTGGY
jgi:hypothetical protein